MLATPTLRPTATATAALPEHGQIVEAKYLERLTPEEGYAVDMYQLRFQTLDETNRLVEIQADMYVPRASVTTTFPVLGHAPGTTGIGDQCAPLSEQARGRNWGNYHGYALEYAAQGYIVVLPNWLGFDDPDRTHAYFIAELEAHVLLDAARAVYHFWDDGLADGVLAQPAAAVFFMGYSSGGHAVFAAKDHAATYTPELPLKGVIGHGPTTNIEVLLREDPIFSPYIVYSFRNFYGSEVIDPAKVFLAPWVTTFDSDILSKCVDEMMAYYSFKPQYMYLPEFRDVLDGNRLSAAFPLFAAKLKANYTGVSGGRQIPVLILQGTGDTVVTPPSQEKFMGELCAMGTSVTYLRYPAVSHAYIRRESFQDTLSWIQHLVEGGLPESDCVDLAFQK